ncbi:MAG: DNA repair protein RecO [Actinomycetota bacterium]|nr:DNA repair protein RecO [Actinomycetota bacterium]
MTLYRAEGVVLRTYRLGEADRIVVLMTAERGKVRAVAKGVRKTKSRFGGRLEPLTRLRLLLYEGRELDVITQADTVEYFRTLREDLTRMTEGLAMVEAVDQLAQQGQPNSTMYRMLVSALRTVDEHPSPLVVAGFYWKLLGLEGMAPVVDSCVRCGAGADGGDVELVALDLTEGGALCPACRRGPAVSPAALAVINQIFNGDLARALTTPAGTLASEVASLATGALEAHIERRLRAVRALGAP